ncbi:Txe/YoeB family addiction module toxin [Pedobacter kyonggii]|jgi:toxin YoeB|uniref:Putative mRNA interferase YoeB n=1 Tax=Pedobacter kyonggii TaxID=1926871 RepID=A0A4Q9HH32_9SPHI|nr:Txe/YoeB family addiction module toxin [Pedobacter kyonggii]TBO43885.1 Txe/YoeB family addiction module toxin [Pedobacter kyonggii]
MEIQYVDDSLLDIKFWKKSGNKAIQKKIEQLILAIIEEPYSGIGKPEPLKYEFSGKWSRRINDEHRIIYEVIEDVLYIYSLKGHYK